MMPRRPSGAAFWIFLVLLALGGGWAANQEWRWPFPALFEKEETDGQAPTPEVVAEQPPVEEPATEEAGV